MSSHASTSHTVPTPWTPKNFEALTAESLAQFPLIPLHRANFIAAPDKSCGKVTKLQDGDIFYSPNCQRDFKEAEYMSGGMQRDPSTAKISEFLKPRWWAGSNTTYLAFLPLHFSTGMPPFQALDCDPYIHINRQKAVFFLDSNNVVELNTLEAQLRKVTNEICVYFKVPEQSPLSHSVLCCLRDFPTRRDAQKAFGQTRDWFIMWAGLLSFNIAVATLSTGDSLDDGSVPSWWLYLEKNEKHPQEFLSAIHSTDLGRFEADNRVGIIISVLKPAPDQPSPDFFCRFNVPIWYPWGVSEMAASLNDEKLRRWAPPVEQLQAVATFFVTDPGNRDPEPWKIWFERCRQALAQRKRVETRAQRIKRESRERNPPTTKVKVFVWRRVHNVVQRFPAGSDYSLKAFGKHQKVYNSVANEWDCSTLFGNLEPDEERLLQDSEILIPEQQLRTRTPDYAAGYDDLDKEMADHADFLSPHTPPALPDPEQVVLGDVESQANVGEGHANVGMGQVAESQVNVGLREEGERQANVGIDRKEGDGQGTAGMDREEEEGQGAAGMEGGQVSVGMDIGEEEGQTGVGMNREEGEIEEPEPITVEDPDPTFEQNIKSEYDWEEYEVVDLLRKLFGLRPPAVLPSNLPSSIPIPARMTKEVGASNDPAFPQSSAAGFVALFWKSISSSDAPSLEPEYWDLDPANTMLSNSTRLRRFKQFRVPKLFRRQSEQRPAKPAPTHGPPPKKKQKLKNDPPKVETEETLWVLDYGEESTAPYQLGVFSIVDMMMICRLPEEHTEVDLLQELVSRGFRCQTLLPHKGVPPSIPPPIVAPPIRSGSYIFTYDDWNSYTAQARALLQNPRIARAALLAGGITWRIALFFRTSIANAVHGQDTSLTRAFAYPSGHRFDGLHPQEADVLSGLYLCYTAASHPDKLSIFPLPDTWKSNVVTSFWTPEYERMFQGWMSDANGFQQPKLQREWVTKIRSPSSLRRAYRTITEKSEQLLSR